MQVSLAIDLKKAYRPIQTYTIGHMRCACGAVLTVACGVQEPHVARGNRCEESNKRSNSSLWTSRAPPRRRSLYTAGTYQACVPTIGQLRRTGPEKSRLSKL
jgi:hypothetical protein